MQDGPLFPTAKVEHAVFVQAQMLTAKQALHKLFKQRRIPPPFFCARKPGNNNSAAVDDTDKTAFAFPSPRASFDWLRGEA